MNATDAEAKSLIVEITNEMFGAGLLTATGGNLSARSPDGETIWITPSGLYKGGIQASDLVRIRLGGTVVEGERLPSIEWQMHAGAYAARPEANGALHAHAPIATAMGIVGLPFPPINTDAVLLRDTLLVPWHMPGTKELADAVAVALRRCRGCFLQNHGLMTVGKTLRDAATRAMTLEETARIVLYCRQFGGGLTLLPDAWVVRLAAVADFL
ncbi:L-fuculose-phosphate aldolase [Myxococcaceae bacterium]|nr:L-fuculose-phosphate aldolase [Myxococcaceae bacterium]